VRDPQLRLSELERVQDEVATLLRTGTAAEMTKDEGRSTKE